MLYNYIFVFNASHWLKTVISLTVVMGITWIIGVLVFSKYLTFVAYISAIAIAFQVMCYVYSPVKVWKRGINDEVQTRPFAE